MRLLERKPAKRLGMLAGKAQDVKRHRWFDGFDWAALEARRLVPPRKPKVRRAVETYRSTLLMDRQAGRQHFCMCASTCGCLCPCLHYALC